MAFVYVISFYIITSVCVCVCVTSVRQNVLNSVDKKYLKVVYLQEEF